MPRKPCLARCPHSDTWVVTGRGVRNFGTAQRMREQDCDSIMHTRSSVMTLLAPMHATTTWVTTATKVTSTAGKGEENSVPVLC